AAIPLIKSVERSADSPQVQHGTRDAPRFLFVRPVMLDIEPRCRAVFLVYCVDTSRIAIGFCVFPSHFGAESALSKRVVEDQERPGGIFPEATFFATA